MYNNNTEELTQRFNSEEFADWQPRRIGNLSTKKSRHILKLKRRDIQCQRRRTDTAFQHRRIFRLASQKNCEPDNQQKSTHRKTQKKRYTITTQKS